MERAPTERLSQRHRRAAALIALAVLVIASASAAYLHSSLTSQPRTLAPTINPLLVTSNPVTYDFVTPSMGWALVIVAGPSSGAGQFRVFRTIDGAKHWQQQLAGQSSFAGFSPITVQFFGKTRGFMAVGGPVVEQLYRTTDGGAHWDRLVLPLPRVYAITFSDATYGWMLALGSGLPGLPRNLYATSDAGQTWQRLPDPPADADYLGFRSPTEAWMGSTDVRLPHVYTSSNGGQSWRRHDLLPPAGGSWAADRDFRTTIQLLPGVGAIASVEAESSTPGNVLFTSVDDGLTWRPVPSPPGDLAYQDSVNWWAMSENELFKSRDAGQSWRKVASMPPNWLFSAPGILDSTHAWASLLGGNGLAVTNDGGLHWTQSTVPQSA